MTLQCGTSSWPSDSEGPRKGVPLLTKALGSCGLFWVMSWYMWLSYEGLCAVVRDKHNMMTWQVASDVADVEKAGWGGVLKLYVTKFGLLKGTKYVMWFESSGEGWGWKKNIPTAPWSSENFAVKCLLRWKRVRMWDSRDTSSPVWLYECLRLTILVSTVPRESVGKKNDIPGLKRPHTALFPHGRNGQTWEGKSTPKRVLLGSFTQFTEEEKDPKISSSYFFSSEEVAGEKVASTFRNSQVRKRALHGQEKMEESWDHPSVHARGGWSK